MPSAIKEEMVKRMAFVARQKRPEHNAFDSLRVVERDEGTVAPSSPCVTCIRSTPTAGLRPNQRGGSRFCHPPEQTNAYGAPRRINPSAQNARDHVIQQTQSTPAKHLVLSIRRYNSLGHCRFVCRREGLEPLQTSSQTSGDEPRPVRRARQRSPFVETPRVFIQQGTA